MAVVWPVLVPAMLKHRVDVLFSLFWGVGCVGGVECVVRVVVWELHSGREHLIFIVIAYCPLVVCGGAENVVIF